MKNLIFLCVASAVFILSVIVLNYAPTITGLVGKGRYDSNGDLSSSSSLGWADFPCSYYSDKYNEYEDLEVKDNWKDEENKKEHLNLLEEGKNDCLRKKAMIGLEYSAFNLDVIFSFVCAILGILLYSGNKVGKIAGLIGLGGGAIGFVLTLVYVIYSGIVFNNDVVNKRFNPSTPSGNNFEIGDSPYSSADNAIESDGAYMEWNGDKYVCIFYDKDNKDKLYRKYSNYGNKYLNYYHFNSKDKDDEYYRYKTTGGCATSNSRPVNWNYCKNQDEKQTKENQDKIWDDNGNEKGLCDKLYIVEGGSDVKKNLYNSWVTTIVFGCFIFVLDAVLAIFGFLVYKDSSGTSGAI